MPTVWLRDDPKHRTRFHRIPDCKQLRKKPAKGEPHDLISVDLNEIYVRPCKTCYPDAPRVKIIKRYCKKCRSATACKHNGGIQVTIRDGRHRWVWPDTNQMPLYRKSA